jgi:hypothetical protein
VSGSSKSLAFTGIGIPAQLMLLVGALLVLFGVALLVLVDAPRRLITQLAVIRPRSNGAAAGGPSNVFAGGPHSRGLRLEQGVTTWARWVLGRR